MSVAPPISGWQGAFDQSASRRAKARMDLTVAASETITLCVPNLSRRERECLAECIETGFVSSAGPYVERFERAFAQWTGARYAIACSSGTAAIHLALDAAGVRKGDLVLTSDFTFIATANPVVYLGAKPGFIDSDPMSWNLDPQVLKSALADLASRNTLPRAVVVAHIYGAPADMGPILDACGPYGIPVIEDAAEALGGRFNDEYSHANCRNRQAGTVGIMGCFSFNGNKLITSGGGGMVTTDDPRLAALVKHISCQAKLPGTGFVHDRAGYNYRMINIAAALGLAQLERIESLLQAKKRIAVRYREFCQRRGLGWQRTSTGIESSDWMPAIAVGENRDSLMKHLLDQGIGCRPSWLPVSSQQPHLHSPTWGSGHAADLARTVLCVPCSTNLAAEDQGKVLAAIDEWIESAKAPGAAATTRKAALA